MTSHEILHIFPTFGLGGQQRRFAELVDQFSSPFHHHIISLSPDVEATSLIQHTDRISISELALDKTALTSFSNLKKLRKIFDQHNPDLVCTYNWGAIEAVIAIRTFFTKHKNVGHLHFEDGFGIDESPTQQNKKRVLARRLLLKNTTSIIPSKTLEHIATDIWKLPAKNIRRIPNGIDTERFLVADRHYDHKRAVKIGYVGAFRQEKNLAYLINLFEQQKAQREADLYLVGDGPEMNDLQSLVQTNSKKERILFPGATTAPEKEYQNFDIFTLTSTTEQMPISLMEAMMAGLPVIATDVGDIRDMVASENHPYIFAIDDEAGMIKGLEELIDNPDLRSKIGSANRAKAIAEFDRKEMVATYEKLFLEQIALD